LRVRGRRARRGKIDRRPRPGLHEALDLLEVLALVVEVLPCHADQLLVGPGSEERGADLEHDLLRGALLLIRGRLRAGLRRPPTSARLAEIPDQLVEAHVRAEEVEGREVARGLRADEPGRGMMFAVLR